MTPLFTFMGEHWLLTLLLTPAFLVSLWLVCSVVRWPFFLAFKAYNRRLRSKNIAAKGWPPAHLDADGDFSPAGDK